MADVTFLQQAAPIDEYGRTLYAVARSIVRALLDQMTPEDLGDFNVERDQVTLRLLAKGARLERDKGMRGDGFEWAVHEALVGGEPLGTGSRTCSWRPTLKGGGTRPSAFYNR